MQSQSEGIKLVKLDSSAAKGRKHQSIKASISELKSFALSLDGKLGKRPAPLKHKSQALKCYPNALIGLAGAKGRDENYYYTLRADGQISHSKVKGR